MCKEQPSFRKAQSAGWMHAVNVKLDNESRLDYRARAVLIEATIMLATWNVRLYMEVLARATA